MEFYPHSLQLGHRCVTRTAVKVGERGVDAPGDRRDIAGNASMRMEWACVWHSR